MVGHYAIIKVVPSMERRKGATKMKDYKYFITYNKRVLAKSNSLEGAKKRYNEIANYLSNPKVVVNGYGIKFFDINLLEIKGE